MSEPEKRTRGRGRGGRGRRHGPKRADGAQMGPDDDGDVDMHGSSPPGAAAPAPARVPSPHVPFPSVGPAATVGASTASATDSAPGVNPFDVPPASRKQKGHQSKGGAASGVPAGGAGRKAGPGAAFVNPVHVTPSAPTSTPAPAPAAAAAPTPMAPPVVPPAAAPAPFMPPVGIASLERMMAAVSLSASAPVFTPQPAAPPPAAPSPPAPAPPPAGQNHAGRQHGHRGAASGDPVHAAPAATPAPAPTAVPPPLVPPVIPPAAAPAAFMPPVGVSSLQHMMDNFSLFANAPVFTTQPAAPPAPPPPPAPAPPAVFSSDELLRRKLQQSTARPAAPTPAPPAEATPIPVAQSAPVTLPPAPAPEPSIAGLFHAAPSEKRPGRDNLKGGTGHGFVPLSPAVAFPPTAPQMPPVAQPSAVLKAAYSAAASAAPPTPAAAPAVQVPPTPGVFDPLPSSRKQRGAKGAAGSGLRVPATPTSAPTAASAPPVAPAAPSAAAIPPFPASAYPHVTPQAFIPPVAAAPSAAPPTNVFDPLPTSKKQGQSRHHRDAATAAGTERQHAPPATTAAAAPVTSTPSASVPVATIAPAATASATSTTPSRTATAPKAATTLSTGGGYTAAATQPASTNATSASRLHVPLPPVPPAASTAPPAAAVPPSTASTQPHVPLGSVPPRHVPPTAAAPPPAQPSNVFDPLPATKQQRQPRHQRETAAAGSGRQHAQPTTSAAASATADATPATTASAPTPAPATTAPAAPSTSSGVATAPRAAETHSAASGHYAAAASPPTASAAPPVAAVKPSAAFTQPHGPSSVRLDSIPLPPVAAEPAAAPATNVFDPLPARKKQQQPRHQREAADASASAGRRHVSAAPTPAAAPVPSTPVPPVPAATPAPTAPATSTTLSGAAAAPPTQSSDSDRYTTAAVPPASSAPPAASHTSAASDSFSADALLRRKATEGATRPPPVAPSPPPVDPFEAGDALMKSERYAEAHAAFLTVAATATDAGVRAQAYSHAASASIELGEHEQVMGEVAQALLKDSKHVPALLLQARAHAALGDLNAVQKSLDAALALCASPGSLPAHAVVANALKSQLEKARAAMKQLRAMLRKRAFAGLLSRFAGMSGMIKTSLGAFEMRIIALRETGQQGDAAALGKATLPVSCGGTDTIRRNLSGYVGGRMSVIAALTAQSLWEDGDTAAARELIAAAIHLDEHVVEKGVIKLGRILNAYERHRDEGKRLHSAGDYRLAGNEFRSSVKTLEGSSPVMAALAHNNAAASFMACGLHNEAIDACYGALRAVPTFFRATLRLSKAYRGMQRFDRELAELNALRKEVEKGQPNAPKLGRVEVTVAQVDEMIATARRDMDAQNARKRAEAEAEWRSRSSRAAGYGHYSQEDDHEDDGEHYYEEEYYEEDYEPPPRRGRSDPFFNFFGGGGRFHSGTGGSRHAPPRRAPSPPVQSLYIVLGVAQSATDADIKQAYRAQARTHHPDKGGDAEKFKRVQQAYETLSNATSRAEHDRELRYR